MPHQTDSLNVSVVVGCYMKEIDSRVLDSGRMEDNFHNSILYPRVRSRVLCNLRIGGASALGGPARGRT